MTQGARRERDIGKIARQEEKTVEKREAVQKKKGRRGVLTVEAAIVLPIFIMVMVFILSMMKLFYFHLVMQQALQNVGRTLSEYGYVLDETVGLEKLNLTEETKQAESDLSDKVNNVVDAAKNLGKSIKGENGEESGNENFLGKVEGVITAGKELGTKFGELSDYLKDLKSNENLKSMLINYLLVSGMNEGSGALVEWMVGDYLKEMQAQNGTISNIRYYLAVDAHEGSDGEVSGTKDIVLIADYDYALNFFFFDKIRIRQSIRVHPWVGGQTEGVKWGE